MLLEALPTILAARPRTAAAGRRARRRGGGGARRCPRELRAARRVPRHGQRGGQGAAAAQRRPLRRAEHRRRELRHHPGRGDGGRRAGARQRPGRVRPGAGHGTAGGCSPTRTPDALATAAVRLLGDPARRAELRERGSAHVRRFDWSTVGADILSVYETVDGRRGARSRRPTRRRRDCGRGSGWRGTEDASRARPGPRPAPAGRTRAERRVRCTHGSLAARDRNPHLDPRRARRDRPLPELDRGPAGPAARPDRRGPRRARRAAAAPGLRRPGAGHLRRARPGRLDRAVRGRARGRGRPRRSSGRSPRAS